MGKVFKIITWIIVLSILYIWISMTFNSCGNKAQDVADNLDETIENVVSETGEAIEETTEEFFEDGEIESIEEDVIEDEIIEDEIVEEIIEEKIIEDTPVYTSSSNGQYMIIAGNYLVESNANEMARKLQKMGYQSAEKVIFDASSYHTVIASRFSDYGEAVRTASNLKAKGIDCYVKKRT